MLFKSAVLAATISTVAAQVTSLVPVWGQCGGLQHTGGTECAGIPNYTCVTANSWYAQCQPVKTLTTPNPVTTTTTRCPQTAYSTVVGACNTKYTFWGSVCSGSPQTSIPVPTFSCPPSSTTTTTRPITTTTSTRPGTTECPMTRYSTILRACGTYYTFWGSVCSGSVQTAISTPGAITCSSTTTTTTTSTRPQTTCPMTRYSTTFPACGTVYTFWGSVCSGSFQTPISTPGAITCTSTTTTGCVMLTHSTVWEWCPGTMNTAYQTACSGVRPTPISIPTWPCPTTTSRTTTCLTTTYSTVTPWCPGTGVTSTFYGSVCSGYRHTPIQIPPMICRTVVPTLQPTSCPITGCVKRIVKKRTTVEYRRRQYAKQ